MRYAEAKTKVKDDTEEHYRDALFEAGSAAADALKAVLESSTQQAQFGWKVTIKVGIEAIKSSENQQYSMRGGPGERCVIGR